MSSDNYRIKPQGDGSRKAWVKPRLQQWHVRDVTKQGGNLPPGDSGANNMTPPPS